jgi:hypothetical protein
MKTTLFPRILVCVCALILAACGGGGGDQTSVPTDALPVTPDATPDPSAEATGFYPFPTIALPPTAGPDLGPPPEMTGVDEGEQPGGLGTLVAVGTVDPDIPAGFDRIVLVRTGGPIIDGGQTLDETIIIERDGTMTRNGASGRASASAVSEIGAMIDAINIFAVQVNYVGPIPSEGERPYEYQLLVVKGFAERMITAQDGLMPEAINSLIAAVLSEGSAIERP